jgi:hypothetical protein
VSAEASVGGGKKKEAKAAVAEEAVEATIDSLGQQGEAA